MAATNQQSLEEEFWALAERQHWVVAHPQLLDLGFTPTGIRHRVATGRLYRIWRGVYVVGRRELTRLGWWMAAVLACGPDAVLSHESAAELWRIIPTRDGAIHVSVIAGYQRRRARIVVHRRLAIYPNDLTTFEGIPVTTPTCTLFDIATRLGRRRLEAAINAADKHDLVSPDELRAHLDSEAGRAGVAVMRDLLDRRTFVLTDSELERRFLPIARAANLPRPETQQWIAGFRVDFHWPALGLVVETDGLRYHRTAAEQAKDRERDQALTAAGLTVLRFTHAQVRYEPQRVEALLTTVARRLSHRLLT